MWLVSLRKINALTVFWWTGNGYALVGFW